MNTQQHIRVAVIQAGSVFMDREATLEKALHLIDDAAKQVGACLAIGSISM